MRQKTISRSLQFSGLGLHSGKEVALKLSPAPANTGIYFLKEKSKIPATVDQVKDTKRGTTLGEIAVTEHLLAAAYGLGIDNLQIEITGDELPVLDGSALPYVEALEQAGIIEQKEAKNPIILEKPVKLDSLEALPYNGFKVDFMVDFAGIGEQRYSLELSPETFKREIAPARTFGYIDEYELLKEQGLARGASLENALVLGKDGYINQPRFPDELVRHKILDLIGDLALLGRPLMAEVKAVKSGHKSNVELVRRIFNP
jgi:UDP-3-O-[3-hydroxymyristoyl] N-acetylglucosamine deacetylase